MLTDVLAYLDAVSTSQSCYLQALTAAVKIFNTVLAVPKLRSSMKAELGALYPLLLLRPIESER